MRVDARQVAAFRLMRHHLLSPKTGDPVTVCRDVCGMQAQLMTAARMNIAARTRALLRADIEAALWEQRALVKTLCMRQTVHLLPAAEWHIYARAVRRSRVAAVVRIMERLRITPADREALLRATLESLEEGPLSKGELTARIRPRVSARVREWMDRVWNAARLALVEGLICYGPDRGQEVTFVRVDHWLRGRRAIEEDEAGRNLLGKFLRAYGPATLRDFCKWSGVPVTEARAWWDGSAEERVEVSIGGRQAWLLRDDVNVFRGAALEGTVVNLLAAFDPFLLAHAEKEHFLDPRFYKRVYRSHGWVLPVVLANGLAVATWTHAMERKRLLVSIEPFGTLGRAVRQKIEREAEHLGWFLGAEPDIVFAAR